MLCICMPSEIWCTGCCSTPQMSALCCLFQVGCLLYPTLFYVAQCHMYHFPTVCRQISLSWVPYQTIPYCALPCRITPYHNVPYCTKLYRAVSFPHCLLSNQLVTMWDPVGHMLSYVNFIHTAVDTLWSVLVMMMTRILLWLKPHKSSV